MNYDYSGKIAYVILPETRGTIIGKVDTYGRVRSNMYGNILGIVDSFGRVRSAQFGLYGQPIGRIVV